MRKKLCDEMVCFCLMHMQRSLLCPFWVACFIKGQVKQTCFNLYGERGGKGMRRVFFFVLIPTTTLETNFTAIDYCPEMTLSICYIWLRKINYWIISSSECSSSTSQKGKTDSSGRHKKTLLVIAQYYSLFTCLICINESNHWRERWSSDLNRAMTLPYGQHVR